MDYDRLREDLKDYFGTAMQFFPAAVLGLSEVELVSEEKLEQMAVSCGLNLEDYKTKRR